MTGSNGRPDFIGNVLLDSPVARHMGLRLVSAAPDRVELSLPFSTANTTVGDVVHGGVIATLADVAGMAALVAGSPPEMSQSATTALAIHYLRAARGTELVAVATVLRRGRSQTVVEVEVRDAGGALVAKATVTGQSR